MTDFQQGLKNCIGRAFGVQGFLDTALAAAGRVYEPRASQVQMAQAVANAMADGDHLFVEAPTGSGKSFAYGVPAAFYAGNAPAEITIDPLTGGERKDAARVVIVTANIALQEQLIQKDLPALQDALPWDFKFSLAKGRTNYFCRAAFYEAQEDGVLDDLADKDYIVADQIPAIRDWANSTTTGDRSELPFTPDGRLWSKCTRDGDDCEFPECSFKGCFVQRAKFAVHASNVIVCNYHLFFINQILQHKGASVLPRIEVVILDEAHKAADIARDCYGETISEFTVLRAGRFLRQFQDHLASQHYQDLLIATKELFAWLLNYSASEDYDVRLTEPVPQAPLKPVLDALEYTVDIYRSHLPRVDEKKLKPITRAIERCEEIAVALDFMLNVKDPSVVVFIDRVLSKKRAATLRAVLSTRRIYVHDVLARDLYKPANSVVLTSATLATGSNFEFAAAETGAEKYQELIVPSPFDMWTQARLLICRDLPVPIYKNAEEFHDEVAQKLVRLAGITRGRMLALFTTYAGVNEAKKALKGVVPYKILTQGDMPRTQLVEEFKEDESSILLGTESFWTGVDVQGPALSCVFIDKLPFTPPRDPVLHALQALEGQACFGKYQLPMTTIAFKQGVGRLIRTMTDYGVVVVGDCRLQTKGYGRGIVASMATMPQLFDDELIGVFLDNPQDSRVFIAPLIDIFAER